MISRALVDNTFPWNAREKLLFLCAFILFFTSLATFLPKNYEIRAGSHISGPHWYYSAFSQSFVEEKSGKRTPIDGEALANYLNAFRFLNRDDQTGYVAAVTAADRLGVSFLVSAITALGFGLVRPSEAFVLTNVCLWIAAILLIFSITTRITKSRSAGLVAALLIAVYPVHTLMLHSVKVAYIGSVFMLFFIWVYEKFREENTSHVRTGVFFFGSFVIGLFSGGGAHFSLLYLVGRNLSTLKSRRSLIDVLLGIAAFVLALSLTKTITSSYGLQSASDAYLTGFFKETLQYLHALLARGQTGSLKFLGSAGFDFWTVSVPHHARSYFLTNPLVLTVGLGACIFRPELRMLAPPFVLLLAAHLAVPLTGWSSKFTYGYLTYPSFLILIIAFSIVAGALFHRRQLGANLLGCALIAGAAALFATDTLPQYRHQMDLYFGGIGNYPNKRIEAFFSPEVEPSNDTR